MFNVLYKRNNLRKVHIMQFPYLGGLFMGKPSIFSNDYGQRMKKRKKMTIINTILVILILISAAYFGGSYYLEKEGVGLSNLFKKFTENIQRKQNTTADNKKPKPNTDTPSPNNNETKQPVEKTNAYFEYKGADGKSYELEYTEISGKREFTGVQSKVGDVQFDVSQDKKRIVFATQAGDIVIGDDLGAIKKINVDSYRSKSAGITIEKKTTLQYYPEYVWAAKPHFTSDNRVVYISYLPYLKGASTFYMWAISIDGSSHRMVGKLTNDINKIVYDGFTTDGALKIKVNDRIFYLASKSYNLTQ